MSIDGMLTATDYPPEFVACPCCGTAIGKDSAASRSNSGMCADCDPAMSKLFDRTGPKHDPDVCALDRTFIIDLEALGLRGTPFLGEVTLPSGRVTQWVPREPAAEHAAAVEPATTEPLPTHRTYEALHARLRSHAVVMTERAPKNSKGLWERLAVLLIAYDEIGPWPDLPDMDRFDASMTAEQMDAALAKHRAAQATWNDYQRHVEAIEEHLASGETYDVKEKWAIRATTDEF